MKYSASSSCKFGIFLAKKGVRPIRRAVRESIAE